MLLQFINHTQRRLHYPWLWVVCTVVFTLCGCEKEETKPTTYISTSVGSAVAKMQDTNAKKYVAIVPINITIKGLRTNITEVGIMWKLNGEPSFSDSTKRCDSASINKMKKAQTTAAIMELSIRVGVAEEYEYQLQGYVVTSKGETIFGKKIVIPIYAIDIEANLYRTVTIGSQHWLAEDLRCKHFRNGDAIDATSAAEVNKNVHDNGKGSCLYNWKTITDNRQLAPEGWHIATDEEWQQLEKHLGMEQSQLSQIGWRGTNQSNLLRDSTLGVWKESDDIYAVWPTNESGFSARPTKTYLPDGKGFGGDEGVGFWWTASSFSDTRAWYRYLDFNNSKIFRAHENSNYGFAVRCIKNQ